MTTNGPQPLDSFEFRRAYAQAKHRLFPDAGSPLEVDGRVILKRLGSGAHGAVYLAYDADLDRQVAIKVIRDVGSDTEGAFEEARALAKLAHPNIVRVFSVGHLGEGVFLEMELLEGMEMLAWLEQRPSDREIVDVFEALGRGLEAVHQAGLVHSDFKPGNVRIRPDGSPVLFDFGLATSSCSARGGTPAYMAPEQIGGTLGPSADQFAFCIALRDALRASTGRLAGAIGPVITRGTARDPHERFPSMAALLEEIRRRLVRRRVSSSVAISLVAAASLFAAVWPSAAETTCVGAEALTSEFWALEDRSALYDHLRNISPPGTGVEQRAVDSLDAYLEDWSSAWNGACTTPRAQGLEDCLESARLEARSTIEALGGAIAPEAPLALEAIGRITSPGVCERASSQAPRADPEGDAAWASAAASFRLGRFDDARARINRALQNEELSERAQARLLQLKIRIETFSPGTERPDREILRASSLARGAGDSELEAEIWLHAASLASRTPHDGADPWLRMAEAALQSPTPRFLASHARATGLAQLGRGETSEAIASLRQAVSLAKSAFGTSHPDIATYVDNLGGALQEAGELDEARVLLEDALHHREAGLGPLHPAVGASLMNLARLDMLLNDPDAALERYARVFEVARFASAERNPGLALVHWARAAAYRAKGRETDALADLRAAHDLREHAFGPCDSRTTAALERWASLAEALSEPGPGVEHDCRELSD